MKEDGTGAEVPVLEVARVVKSVAGPTGEKISGEIVISVPPSPFVY